MKFIIQLLKKPYLYSIIFSIVLLSYTTYALLDVFVIPHYVSSVGNSESSSSSDTTESGTDSSSSSDPIITDTSYEDSNIQITITTIREDDTNVYIADIQLSSPDYLKTALAQNTYGTNVTEKTSSIAASNSAILAINGDYYGANKKGYVIKNGTIYRDTVRESSSDDLVIYKDGSFSTISESQISASQLVSDGVVQSFAFGPVLVENGQVSVTTSSEVDQSMTSNPRTAIGIIDSCHYIMVVSDGRTSESTGLSLYQLAGIMQDYGCTTAYNLDGGGSSTMYFLGNVVNQPTTSGKSISERAVSDIVYIGY